MEKLKEQYYEKFFSEEDVPIDPEEIWKWFVSNRLENMPKIAEVYAGRITISRATSNVEDDYMNIEIRTEKVKIRCKMTMIDYAFAISGLSMQPIDVDLSNFTA